jgi:hypothetical protein
MTSAAWIPRFRSRSATPSATQIVRHGPLRVRAAGVPVYLATSLNGRAAYFTASLESAIQAGEAAARAFDPRVECLEAAGAECVGRTNREASPQPAAQSPPAAGNEVEGRVSSS